MSANPAAITRPSGVGTLLTPADPDGGDQRGNLGRGGLHGHLAAAVVASSREKRLWASMTGFISTVVT
jgi:hypothetical protein